MECVLYNQWKQLPLSADALFSEVEKNSLFFSRSWLENVTAHAMKEAHSIVLICVVEKEQFLAILPMMECSQGSLSSLSSNFTSLYSLLITANKPQDAIFTCLANYLFDLPASPIRLEPIDEHDSNILRLRQSMEGCGFQSYSYFRFYNWIHSVGGQSFEEYMEERPAKLKNTIERKQRKLAREHQMDIRLYKNTAVDRALLDYQSIYKASWKASEYFSEFTPSLVKDLSRLGWLRLAILYVNKEPIAAQIWFVVNGKASIYRLVYDKKWKNYSPGSILTQYLMRHVINIDHVLEIDFLTGNERYKQDWMTVQRARMGLRFARPTTNKFSRTIKSIKKLMHQL